MYRFLPWRWPVIVVAVTGTCHAALITYRESCGPSEASNASPGTGFAMAVPDDLAHIARERDVQRFAGIDRVAHPCPTAVAFAGVANVATQTPSFVGFHSAVWIV
jgi:hypothetical protein